MYIQKLKSEKNYSVVLDNHIIAYAAYRHRQMWYFHDYGILANLLEVAGSFTKLDDLIAYANVVIKDFLRSVIEDD